MDSDLATDSADYGGGGGWRDNGSGHDEDGDDDDNDAYDEDDGMKMGRRCRSQWRA